MTIEQALLAAIISLSGVVSYLFKLVLASKKECEDDRKRLWAHIDALENHIQQLERNACDQPDCGARRPPTLPKRPTRMIFAGKKPVTP